MQTECTGKTYEFGRVDGRRLVADFAGGAITSNAGALLLRQTAAATGVIRRLAGCFQDRRAPELTEHSVETLLGQRIFGLALGYEDLVDHDQLRHDPLLGACLGKLAGRRKGCAALAGKSTLNRLERAPEQARETADGRYHKIGCDPGAIEDLFVDLFLDAHARAPEEIVLDLDATDAALHGAQEGRFFHGYYGCYCYLPLYVFCGEHLLSAKLRRADIDASAGATEEIARIVARIRARWPAVRILLRADSGFAREALMSWAEANRVGFVFGLARNKRLAAKIEAEMAEAAAAMRESGAAERRFAEFSWRTLKGWSRERRVVAKAEALPPTGTPKANPRFVVTSLTAEDWEARALYEELYCARGDMENRIKDQQLDLFADRVSAATMRANQLRLWFAGFAYVLVCALRRIGLARTRLERASPGRIRLALLKLGALVTVSARRVRAAIASACPFREEFALAQSRLAAATPF